MADTSTTTSNFKHITNADIYFHDPTANLTGVTNVYLTEFGLWYNDGATRCYTPWPGMIRLEVVAANDAI